MPNADPVYPNREGRAPEPLQAPTAGMERELPEHGTPSHLGRMPGTAASPRLNSAAESVGSALGTAVSGVRHLPNTLQEAKSRFTVIRGRKGREVKEAADQALDRIRDTGVEVKNRIRETSGAVKDQARETLLRARTGGERLAHEYPLHVIAGAVAFGMLVGMGLRLWRDYAS